MKKYDLEIHINVTEPCNVISKILFWWEYNWFRKNLPECFLLKNCLILKNF